MGSSDCRKLTLISLLIAGGRAADELSTYILDPKLTAEANLFVRNVWLWLHLPWSWAMITCLEAVFVSALVVAEWYYIRNYRSLFPPTPGYSFGRFAIFCWCGREGSVKDMLRCFVPRGRLFLLTVNLLVAVVIATSYWAGANNLCLHYLIDPIIKADPVHARTYPAIAAFDIVQNVLLVLVPIGSLLFGLFWMHWRSYRDYLAGTSPAQSP